MANLKLNIYDKNDKNTVAKIYEAEGYDLMLGTTEDLMKIIDFDNLDIDDKTQVGITIMKCYPLLSPLLKDIFPGLTDEELRCVKFKELIPLFYDIVLAVIDSLNVMNEGN